MSRANILRVCLLPTLLLAFSCGAGSPAAPPEKKTVGAASYPSVAGLWNWREVYQLNSCDDGTQRDLILVLTQDAGAGTITAYSAEDSSLTSPLAAYGYQMNARDDVPGGVAALVFTEPPATGVDDTHYLGEYEMTPTSLAGTFRQLRAPLASDLRPCEKTGTGVGTRRN